MEDWNKRFVVSFNNTYNQKQPKLVIEPLDKYPIWSPSSNHCVHCCLQKMNIHVTKWEKNP